MSETAFPIVIASQSIMCTCTDAVPPPESSKGLIAEDSLCYLVQKIEELDSEHCKGYCYNCREKDFKKSEPLSTIKYPHLKKMLHTAFRKLPLDTYLEVSAPANGKCPACLIVEALDRLKLIVYYSNVKPIGYETFPCFWEPWDGGGAIIGSDALLGFSIDSPCIRSMPPEDKKEIRDIVLPAQAIIQRVKKYAAGKKERLSTADLWVLLGRETAIASLSRHPSFEWTQWAKNGLLKDRLPNHGEHMSIVLSVAVSCYSALAAKGATEILYEDLCQLYTAAYYLSSGDAINSRQFGNILSEIVGTFLVCTSEDFGNRYYALTTLGKTVARKHIGVPPPFFCDALQGTQRSEVVPAPIVFEPTTVTQAKASNGFDFAADLAQNNQANQSVIVEQADKNEATAKSAVENNVLKQEANPEVHFYPDTAKAVKYAVEGVRAAQQDTMRSVQDIFQSFIPVTDNQNVLKKGKVGRGRPSDADEENDAKHAEGWEKYREVKRSKAEYAEDNGMTKTELNTIIDRVRKKRKQRSE